MARFHVLTDRPRDGRVIFNPRWKASEGRTVSSPPNRTCQLQDPGLQLEVVHIVSWSHKKRVRNWREPRSDLAAFAVLLYALFLRDKDLSSPLSLYILY